MQLKYDSVDSFVINLGTFLSSRGVTDPQVDITAVRYQVKNSETDADVDAIATLGIGTGLTWISDTEISAAFSYANYGAGLLEVGGVYVTGIGFKSATWTKWFEASLSDPSLEIVQDFFHD